MAIGTGLGSQLSFASESTYATNVTPSKFLPVNKASLKEVKNFTQGGGLQGAALQIGARRNVTTVGGTGSIETQVFNRGLGLWLQTLMGTTVTPVQQSSTTAYKQTHTFASDNSGKMLTVQSAVPTTAGTLASYTFAGCKVSSAEFSFDVASISTASFMIDAAKVVTGVSVPAASYDNTLRPFVGTDAAITVGTYGSTSPATAAVGVKKITVKVERPMKMDRYYAGQSGVKAEPVPNDFAKITGTIDADFVDKTLWADRFATQSGFSLQVTLTGAAIGSSGFNDTFQVTLPCVYLDGDTPTVEGQDVISGSFPFTCLWDGTNTPSIVVMSNETTL